jgi:hypothetical protein
MSKLNAPNGARTVDGSPAPTPAGADGLAEALGASRTGSRTVNRITVNLRSRDDERLKRISTAIEGSDNEAVRAALAFAEIFLDVHDRGGKIIVEDATGHQQVLQIVM